MKSVIVLLAYGADYILKQNLFCIVSLFKAYPSLKDVEKILIYTDQAGSFQKFLGDQPLFQYEHISPERLTRWRGDIEFVHRVKVEMMRDAATLFPSHNLFYLDGDTYFTKDPSPLMAMVDSKNSVMHEAENVIDRGRDPLTKKVSKFLKRTDFQINGKSLKVPSSTTMWNAGTIGISPVLFKDLDSVLAFTDQAYSAYQKHIMEQLAFSYFIEARTTVHAGGDYIHHYWRQKDEYNQLVQNFLEKTGNLDAALKAYDKIQWPGPPQPKKTFFQKLLGKFSAEATVS